MGTMRRFFTVVGLLTGFLLFGGLPTALAATPLGL